MYVFVFPLGYFYVDFVLLIIPEFMMSPLKSSSTDAKSQLAERWSKKISIIGFG